MQQVSHSELRHRILSALNLEPANSVTSLAQRLEVFRPSVSRAVKSLQDVGFVTRTGRNLALSGAGQEELRRLDDALSTKVAKDTDLVTRLLGQAIVDTRKQFDALTSTIGSVVDSPGLRAMEGLVNIPTLQVAEAFKNSPLMQAVEAIKSNSILQVAETIKNNSLVQAAEAFKATALVQTSNLDLLKAWHVEIPSPISHLISENNLVIGSMLSDLEAITNVGKIADQALDGLISQIALTTKAYETYFIDAVSGIGQILTVDSLRQSISLPTVAAASLVGTTRSIVESEIIMLRGITTNKWEETKPPVSLKQYPATTSKLEAYLKPLGQRFVDKWEGAWQTLHSGNKDRHSQATHSGRELLMQVLEDLAPDNVFTKEDYARHKVKSNSPTRRMQIEYILGGDCHSSVELIDNMANTLISMYRVLLGETHRRDDEKRLDDTIAGMLGALGNLLIMLLSMRSNIGD